MNVFQKPLSSRAIGAYPLSIGTSLAFESMAPGPLEPYDPTRVVPDKVDLTKYPNFFINLVTLYRNIVGALDKGDAIMADPSELYEVLEHEISVIAEIVRDVSFGKCRLQFYSCIYDSQYKRQGHNAIQLRYDKTDLQKAVAAKMQSTMALFYKRNGTRLYHKYDDTLDIPTMSTCLIMTHFPYDLLSYKKARRMDLLETHTGKLKTRQLWYTKYHKVPGHELSTLPFTEKLLKIFGDGPMFIPLDIRFRKMILDISIQCRWTPLTTEAKLRADLDQHLKERYLYEMYTSI